MTPTTTRSLPLANLNGVGKLIKGMVLQEYLGTAQPTVYLDEIGFAAGTSSSATPTATPASATACSTVPAYTEVRPGNTVYNQTPGRATDPSKVANSDSFRPYYLKIDGSCTGTTEQILEWAAKKWGFGSAPSVLGGPALGYPDLAKAQAVAETWWHQEAIGPHGELGILQVSPNVWPDPLPAGWSTAYSADYAMAVVRMHYDGNSWLGAGTKGDLRNAVAAWECGCAWNGWNQYANYVFGYYDSKPWKRPGQPPEWF
jgi:hypothetical protein